MGHNNYRINVKKEVVLMQATSFFIHQALSPISEIIESWQR